MYILGVSAMEHDTAAALIDGQGTVVAAIEEGKLGRSRALGGIPRAAIRYCLERAKIGWPTLRRWQSLANRALHSTEGHCFEHVSRHSPPFRARIT